jgi:hypothetical protein
MGSEWSLSLAGDERFVFNPAEAVGHFALNLAAPWERMVSPAPVQMWAGGAHSVLMQIWAE